MASSHGIIRWQYLMASFDGSHHMMASIIHPSLDGIILWFPSFDGFHHLDGSWLSSYDGSYHSHHMMALIIHPSFDGIIRWFPSFDGFHHLD
eukprot:scaffold168477_cov63-Cyclotella_meneghiniana.AAC.1